MWGVLEMGKMAYAVGNPTTISQSLLLLVTVPIELHQVPGNKKANK
jgi:hypothetical protein